MQIEIYQMNADNDILTITLDAICDTFSSLLWDVEYYQCGRFEVYIAATPQNIRIFQTGRIVGRSDDKQHLGIIESLQIDTDLENGDYLTVRGRFLMCLLERRIIYPTYSVTAETTYADMIHAVVTQNAISSAKRKIAGLSIGAVHGSCWTQKTKLQISYDNLMDWIYTICLKIGGIANIRLNKLDGEKYEMVFDLSEGTNRSVMQDENPHIVFSDAYSNLLSFSYAQEQSIQHNFAYIFGQGKGVERKQTTYCESDEPIGIERYEVYVDADDIAEEEQLDGETKPIPEEQYLELLKTRGSEKLLFPLTASESTIATNSTQYQYSKDYVVGDYVTVEHRRFGMLQSKIQLIGMIESFDQNGRTLSPTFKEG